VKSTDLRNLQEIVKTLGITESLETAKNVHQARKLGINIACLEGLFKIKFPLLHFCQHFEYEVYYYY
jgi:hypothetical protein